MRRGRSLAAEHAGNELAVPKVAWQQLEGGEVKVLGSGHYAVVYSATLKLPNGQRVAVALKSLTDKPLTGKSSPLEEARVLQALAGIEGVPNLYGITGSPPHVLVMSHCSGFALSLWRRWGEVRTCLLAIRELCDILTKMHFRGVTHGDLHGSNILVSLSNSVGRAHVWLIDFGQARRNADSKAMNTDVRQTVKLLTNILMTMEEGSDRDIYHRRREIFEVLNPQLNLDEISSLLCSVLHSHSDETVCMPDP